MGLKRAAELMRDYGEAVKDARVETERIRREAEKVDQLSERELGRQRESVSRVAGPTGPRGIQEVIGNGPQGVFRGLGQALSTFVQFFQRRDPRVFPGEGGRLGNIGGTGLSGQGPSGGGGFAAGDGLGVTSRVSREGTGPNLTGGDPRSPAVAANPTPGLGGVKNNSGPELVGLNTEIRDELRELNRNVQRNNDGGLAVRLGGD